LFFFTETKVDSKSKWVDAQMKPKNANFKQSYFRGDFYCLFLWINRKKFFMDTRICEL